jgi:hypothetical protein
MDFQLRQSARVLTAIFLTAVMGFTQTAKAQAADHLVSPQELNKAAQEASHARQQNIETLRDAFSSEKAQKALEAAHMNPQQVQNAVAGLSDEELAQLSQRAGTAQADFSAGNMTDHDLLLILVIVAALILIIVAVH